MSKILLVSFIGYQEYLFFIFFFNLFQKYITYIVKIINSWINFNLINTFKGKQAKWLSIYLS